MDNDKITKQIEEVLGICGKLLSYSKSRYRKDNPKDIILFNSNIFIEIDSIPRKVWFGDLNVTKQKEQLQELSKKLNTKLYCLYEYDGRWLSEEKTDLARAVVVFNTHADPILREDLCEFYTI
jgi:hypothetical protein